MEYGSRQSRLQWLPDAARRRCYCIWRRIFASGSGTFTGNYDNFEYKIPENADNDLETQNIVYDEYVTILVPAGIYDYVIINPTPGDRLWIAAQNGTAGGRGDDIEFRSGCSYWFLVTLNASGNDNTDVEIYDPFAPTVPLDLEVEPAATYAEVTWGDDHDAAWNLRWRPYTPNAGYELFWGFEEDADFEGWMVYDKDGDGNNWGYDDSGSYAHTGNTTLVSASYNGTGLTPDNWMISPAVTLGGTLKLWAGQRSSYYPDNFGVYVFVGELTSEDDFDNFVQVGSDAAPTSWTELTYDLSQFAGQEGHFAIRHYNCEDQWALFIDDITLIVPGDEPAAWVYANDLDEMYYKIEGLDPETQYEVQVQAISADERVSDWTDSNVFTTLGEEPVIPDVYMLGGDDQGWAPNRGIKFNYNEEDNIYTLNYTFPAETNYFGFTTELAEYDDQGSWDYIEPYRFGAVAEGDNFIFYDEYDGQPLDLTWDAYKAFQIGAGEYNITVDLTSMKVILEKVNVEPPFIRGDVDNSGDVKIADVTALINYLLSGDATNVNVLAADCDESGDVKIADVTALINYLLSGTW